MNDSIIRKVENGTEFQVMNGNWLRLCPKLLEEKENAPGLGIDKSDFSTPEMFIENAFLLWLSRDVIYSDSRLFLATVYAGNRVSPDSCLEDQYPCLGAMLEWWERCDGAHMKQFDDEELVVISHGSTLSGRHECFTVNALGHVARRQTGTFSHNWSALVEINKRYRSLRADYRSYSMNEVVKIISEKCPRHLLEVEKLRREMEYSDLNRLIMELTVQCDYYESMYYTTVVRFHYEAFKQMFNLRDRLLHEAEEIASVLPNLQQQVKQHKITQSRMLEQWLPLKSRRRNNLYQVDTLVYKTLRDAFPDLVKDRPSARRLLPVIEEHCSRFNHSINF